MNLNSTIIPKSNQLNSDDLISGPRTIKITNVLQGDSKEQPISITFEDDNARPYKPSKSMRRVLVTIWGSEGDVYVGRRLTLYRDASVKFGGDQVGGIKISHASDIAGTQSMMLTETRGKKKPHVVEPLPPEQAKEPPKPLVDLPEDWETLTPDQRGENRARKGSDALKAWWSTLSVDERKTLKPKLDGEWKTLAAEVK